jgi:hypothetical protein
VVARAVARAVTMAVVVAAMMTVIATASVAAAWSVAVAVAVAVAAVVTTGAVPHHGCDNSGSAPSINAVHSYLIKPITIPRYLTTVYCLCGTAPIGL